MAFLDYRTKKSRAIIAQMLELCERPYLALSFGKDSVAMLDLVREQAPDIPCVFGCTNETYLLGNYEELVDAYRQRGANIVVANVDRFSIAERGYEMSGEIAGKLVFNAKEFFDNYDGCFMGLRIEESNARRITLVRKDNNVIGPRIMQYKTGRRAGMYRACPMADWKDYEVLNWIRHKNLPSLNAYSEGHTVRTSTMVTSNSLGYGNVLDRVKRQDIGKYNLLMELMPELRST
jgi:sulfate adenylyltransferase subunit 2